jgi:hypothetical protein
MARNEATKIEIMCSMFKIVFGSIRGTKTLILIFLAGLFIVGCGKQRDGSDRVEREAKADSLVPDAPKVAGSLVTYPRSRYSAGLSGTGGEFLPVSAEEAELSSRLLSRLAMANGQKSIFEEVLAEARTMESRLILEVAEKVLESNDPDIRAQALMLVDGVTTGEILPLIEKGMKDANLDVRQLAIETALPVKSPGVEKLVVEGMLDSDMTIRQTALQVGINQKGELAERALVAGIASQHEDVGMSALALAENELSKRLLPAVMGALEHSSNEIRESARETLYFFFHESFASRQAAERWWTQNQSQYDNDLVFTGEIVPGK